MILLLGGTGCESSTKLSKFTVHVLHCLPEFVHSLLMVLCYTFVFIF